MAELGAIKEAEASGTASSSVDTVDYPPKYSQDFSRASWTEATKDDNQIDVSKELIAEDLEYIDDDNGSALDEFHVRPTFRGVVQWINCLIFDAGLLVVELAISLWLASGLFEQGLITSYRSIPILLIIPILINCLVWLGTRSTYSSSLGKGCFTFILVFLGVPSPLLMYIWHLYLAMFDTRSKAVKSKRLANTFRMVQAICFSVPVLLVNLITLINVLRVPDREHEQVDLDLLFTHLGDVKMHGIAFFISLINVVRASALFNERETFTILFFLVSFPFLLITVLTRIFSFGIILAFVDPKWYSVLLLGLTFVNLILYFLCRKSGTVLAPKSKRQKVTSTPRPGAGRSSKYLRPITNNDTPDDTISAAESGGCCPPNCTCCTGIQLRNRSYTYAIEEDVEPRDNEVSFRTATLKGIALSVCSVFIPAGYSNDYRMHHPRLKGGLFLCLNFVVTAAILGPTLGYTILHWVPNTIKGVAIPQPSFKVMIPGSKVVVEAGGLDVSLDLPHTKMDLGSMPKFSATLDTSSTDYHLSLVVPIILTFFVLPFVCMRAAMMELDCFITRRKLLGVVDMESHRYRAGRRKRFGANSRRSSSQDIGRVTLVDTIAQNSYNCEIKTRMYTTILCGMIGMGIMNLVFMILGSMAFMAIRMTSGGH